jgi:excisionase family DNA binding protein
MQVQNVLLTVEEVASVLRISERTVKELATDKGLPAVKVGKVWRFSRTALEKMLETEIPKFNEGSGAQS